MERSFLEECLHQAWTSQYGDSVKAGSLKLSPEVVQEFRDQFDSEDAAKRFIIDSVAVWARRVGHLKVPPPFYASKMLFSERQVDLLQRYRRTTTRGDSETEIYGECLRLELDYLRTRWAIAKAGEFNRWDLLSPNPHWIVAGAIFKRFTASPFAEQKVTYLGRVRSLNRTINELSMPLKQNKALREMFSQTAQKAFVQARQSFLVTLGVASVHPDRLNEMAFSCPIFCEFANPIAEADQNLFSDLMDLYTERQKHAISRPD